MPRVYYASGTDVADGFRCGLLLSVMDVPFITRVNGDDVTGALLRWTIPERVNWRRRHLYGGGGYARGAGKLRTAAPHIIVIAVGREKMEYAPRHGTQTDGPTDANG